MNAQQLTPPVFVSTWSFGQPVNDAAVATFLRTGQLLDAIEQGIWVAEADPQNATVGLGGLPNRAGVVQLDACIMWGPTHRAGSVAALEQILHPISVARRIMERTPHVMLVGRDAQQFALEQGFELTELLTEQRRRQWQEWCAEQAARSAAGPPSHDTITLLGLGPTGELAGGCSTSGRAYKLPGRVGDSPIIGSGLYVDSDVGAAGATGWGENLMRHCAAMQVVQRMREGLDPMQACRETVARILAKDRPTENPSVNVLALDRHGRWGAAGTDPDYCCAVASPQTSFLAPPLRLS